MACPLVLPDLEVANHDLRHHNLQDNLTQVLLTLVVPLMDPTVVMVVVVVVITRHRQYCLILNMVTHGDLDPNSCHPLIHLMLEALLTEVHLAEEVVVVVVVTHPCLPCPMMRICFMCQLPHITSGVKLPCYMCMMTLKRKIMTTDL